MLPVAERSGAWCFRRLESVETFRMNVVLAPLFVLLREELYKEDGVGLSTELTSDSDTANNFPRESATVAAAGCPAVAAPAVSDGARETAASSWASRETMQAAAIGSGLEAAGAGRWDPYFWRR